MAVSSHFEDKRLLGVDWRHCCSLHCLTDLPCPPPPHTQTVVGDDADASGKRRVVRLDPFQTKDGSIDSLPDAAKEFIAAKVAWLQ